MKIYGKNVALEALKENKKVHKIYLSNKFKDEEILSLIERKNINTKLLL
jgi:tRNA G18 (ribose-2'-O)-methylase SpoU